MSPIKCISSYLMTGLFRWRNPAGEERLWFSDEPPVENRCKRLSKIATTEIGLSMLTTAAAVETAAYSYLALASYALRPITDKPRQFFVKLLQSSSVTIGWGAVSLLANPFSTNIVAHESIMRFYLQALNSKLTFPHRYVELFRPEDQQDFERRAPGYIVEPIRHDLWPYKLEWAKIVERELAKGAGANFLVREVLSGASPETINAFKELDPDMYLFVLTKAIFICACGPWRGYSIPKFFKPATQELVRQLRLDIPKNDPIINKLAQVIANPAQFEIGPPEEMKSNSNQVVAKPAIAKPVIANPAQPEIGPKETMKSAFKKLRAAASEELQGSFFTTQCWKQAVEDLSRK